MATGPIKLHIADVLTAVPSQVGVDAGLVMLTEDDEPHRSLRIIIGQPEANAIYSAWHGNTSSRPSTWDLFVSAVVVLGGRIDRVVITAVHEERHYFAHLEIEQGGERRTVACRPSDGIAVAVRGFDVEILAEPSVLEAAGVLPDGTKVAGHPEPGTDLAEREAALAAREAELAERERLLLTREQGERQPASHAQVPGVGDATDAAAPPAEESPVPAPEVPEPKVPDPEAPDPKVSDPEVPDQEVRDPEVPDPNS